MPASPRVSVIVPNYNYGCYLQQRLQSVFDQTFQDFELLYLDDASTDDSEAVFSRFAGDARVRAFRNETNGGNVFKQWNKGVREAKGEFIWLAEADDLADPRLLEVLVALLESDPEIGIAYCGSHIIDENGVIVERAEDWLDNLDPLRWKSNFRNDGRDECARFLVDRNTIFNASAVVFRREVFEKIGFAEEKLKLSGDWITWARMLFTSDLAYHAEPLNYFRRHSRTVRSSVDQSAVRVLERYLVVEEILRSVKVEPSMHEQMCNVLVEEWTTAVLPRKHASQRRYNRAIYRVAQRIDARLHFRLARRLKDFTAERLSTRLSHLPLPRKGDARPA